MRAKALLSFAASFGHVVTYFPGLEMSLGSAGCIPYHLVCDLGGRR